MTITKICRVCGQEKREDELSKNSRSSHGIENLCKVCANERNRRRYHADLATNRKKGKERAARRREINPESIRQNQQRYRENNTAKIRQKRSECYHANVESSRQRSRESVHKWRKEHPEQAKEYQRRWEKANPDKAKESDQRYRKNSRERRLERDRARYQRLWQEDPERIRERNRRWVKQNPQKQRESVYKWAQSHPDAVKAACQRYEARKRNLPDTLTSKDWRRCQSYWGNCCAACGSSLKIHADHWVPLSSPNCPGTTPDNIVPLCAHCNISKSAFDPREWLNRKFGPAKAQEILDRVEEYFSTVRRNENES